MTPVWTEAGLEILPTARVEFAVIRQGRRLITGTSDDA